MLPDTDTGGLQRGADREGDGGDPGNARTFEVGNPVGLALDVESAGDAGGVEVPEEDLLPGAWRRLVPSECLWLRSCSH